MKSLVIRTPYLYNTKQTLDRVHIAYKLIYKQSDDVEIISSNHIGDLIDEEITLSVSSDVEGLSEEQSLCNSIEESRDLLRQLSDSRRRIVTIYDINKSYLKSTKVISSFIKFRHITEAEIEQLVVRYEWPNKVFDLEGITNLYIKSVEGSLGCINGICLVTLNKLLNDIGLSINDFIIHQTS